MGWTYGWGPGCQETKIGEYVDDKLLAGKDLKDKWLCLEGCNKTHPASHPEIGSVFYYCMAADITEGWEQGQNIFNYKFEDKGPFVVGHYGENWMALDNSRGDGPWQIATTVNLQTRSDTGTPNSSPVALSQTLYYMQYECQHKLRVPVMDPDGDRVRCRWAVGSECQAVCKALPGAVLDQKTCTITFETIPANSYHVNGYYAVALAIEDYPRNTILLDGVDTKTPTDSLSSIPIQFLIQAPTYPVPCDVKPRFVTPTPAEDSVVVVHAGDVLYMNVVADNMNDTSAKIRSIQVMGPISLHQSKLVRHPKLSNTFQKTLTWNTSHTDLGDHLVCANAVNERGKNGDARCFTISVVEDPCDSKPCLNSGVCRSSKGVFTCDCLSSSSGDRCHKVLLCELHNPCSNGGLCNDTVSGASCHCIDGWEGKYCSVRDTRKTPRDAGIKHVRKSFAPPCEACMQGREYSNCNCFVSPYVTPEVDKSGRKSRDIFGALIGLLIGLFISCLAYGIYRWCRSKREEYDDSHRKKPAPRPSWLVQRWANAPTAPADTRMKRLDTKTIHSGRHLTTGTSNRNVTFTPRNGHSRMSRNSWSSTCLMENNCSI